MLGLAMQLCALRVAGRTYWNLCGFLASLTLLSGYCMQYSHGTVNTQ